MSEIDRLLEANQAYTASFAGDNLPAPPARRVAVVTCMDARLNPAEFLGLERGDAHVIRNAGGRATDDALRSLIVSHTLLGTLEIAVIHHTGCGMLAFTNDELRARLAGRGDAGGIDFLPFSDNEASVREDVERIRSSPFIPGSVTVSGYIYDLATGALTAVAGAGG
ncbi:MAG: beta-class carbonic anhydrase [Acidimicrobiales bacterium]